ncbi:MAG: efflux RND transporter periplasmic adaptor subunit [Anaerolineae bacterium]
MFRRRLTTVVSLIVVIGIMFGLGACASISSSEGGRSAEATPTPIPTSVVPTNPTYEVQRGTVIRQLQFSGRVAPVLEEELFFKTSGYVDAVYVRRNDEVKAGDLLAELEVTDLKNQITQVEAELQAVQLDYERRITEASNNVRGAELRLSKLQASGNDSQILSARIALERAQERLANAQDEYNKSLDRHWERPEVREAYADAVREAQWNLELAQSQYNDALNARARTAYDIELAQMDLDLAELRLAEIQTGLDVTRTQLSLQRLRDQLNDARIVAPFDGVILQSNVMEGRQVQGYSPVMTLADPTEVEISADLQSSEMSELSEGMEVVAEFVNRPGNEFTGMIRRLPYPYSGGGLGEDVRDEDPSVRITLDNADETGYEYELGDRLRMTVELERSENTLWLPPQAVRTFEGRSFVVVQEGGAQIRRDVRLGIKGEGCIEILEGVEEGQTVVAP